MLTLQITKDQVFTLIDQLSLNEQQEVLQYLVEKAREALDDTPDIVIEGIKQGLKEAMSGQTMRPLLMLRAMKSVRAVPVAYTSLLVEDL
jgi:hypothetical protein